MDFNMHRGPILFLVLLICYASAIMAETISSKSYDANNVEITRQKHKFSHFKWSGVFPLEGGFIEDPHFLYARPASVPEDIGEKLGNRNARYQLYQINPYFKDKTSEWVLAFEDNKRVYEYKINIQNYKPLNPIGGQPVYLFLYHSNIGLFFVLPVIGFSKVDLPLGNGTSLAIEPLGSQFANLVVTYLKDSGNYHELGNQLCKTKYKEALIFYEKAFGSCAGKGRP